MTRQNRGWKTKAELDASDLKPQPNIYDWLVKPQNLTETIRKTGKIFSLQVLNQSVGRPEIDEISAFEDDATDASVALIRTVFLNADAQPVIFARVIVPETTYLNYQNAFDNLGHSAIGNTLLYHNPDVTRTSFEYKPLDATPKICHPESNFLWARRSIFKMPKGCLLITETFLNTLPPYPT